MVKKSIAQNTCLSHGRFFSSTIELVYNSVAAGVARRREGVRGIFFPRGGTLWCKANPFAVIKGGKG